MYLFRYLPLPLSIPHYIILKNLVMRHKKLIEIVKKTSDFPSTRLQGTIGIRDAPDIREIWGQPSGFLPNICQDIQNSAWYLSRYPEFCLILVEIINILPDICPDIQYPTGYLSRHPVSFRILVKISSILLDICQDIQYPSGYL